MIRHLLLMVPFLAGSTALSQQTSPLGIGGEPCRSILGRENISQLAQAGDWVLGYMAGRMDQGAMPENTELSLESSVDVAAGLVLRCREDPDAPLIDAVRTFADGIFAAPAPRAVSPPGPPPARPEDLS